jgi:hypothetical protein
MFPASKSLFGAGVGLDVFHELRCLVRCIVSVVSLRILSPLLTSMCQNIIRKYFYPQRYNMSLFEDDGERVSYKKWIYLDHCNDTLRQSLMCNANVSLQGCDWFQELHYIRVRIDTIHRCRYFDRIRDWAWERSVPWNSHMAHVDEETGRVVDYGFVPDPQLVHEFTPEGFHYTRDDM